MTRTVLTSLLAAAAVGLPLAGTASAQAATPALYVGADPAFNTPTHVLGFAANASGAAAPLTDLTGTATDLGGAGGLTRDQQGHLWVSNPFSQRLTEYAAG